mgnify:FL=1
MIGAATSLAFRSLLKSTASRAGLGRAGRRVTGLTPAAAALHAALVAADGPVCLVVPTDTAVDEMTSDARSFLAALEGLSDHDAAEAVLPLPSQEVDPYRSLAPHLQIASARARALFALASGRARLIVASARALLPRASDPARLAAAGFTIAPGDEIAPADLGERLAFAGFSPEDPVDQAGELRINPSPAPAAVRGRT